LAGWIGMVGCVLMLHFGLFEILAWRWQRAGFPVKPVMNAPVISGSLSEFWGRRWNTAFNRIAHDFFWLPIKRWLGVAGATLVTFAISGIIHELVISVPARGGYGLPTMYFLIQGLGVVFERSQFARERGIGGNWFYAAVFTLGPAFWLFHPPFIRNVILPMLHAMGAI
jgi:D-alanyl-lipoteichoic acid acyltransferase DltB (MBOAT superfamily)